MKKLSLFKILTCLALIFMTACKAYILSASISAEYPPFTEYELSEEEASRVLDYLDTIHTDQYEVAPEGIVGNGIFIDIKPVIISQGHYIILENISAWKMNFI